MEKLLTCLNQIPEFEALLAAMEGGRCPAAVSGLSAVHRAFFAAGILTRTGRSVVMVCADAPGHDFGCWYLVVLLGKLRERKNGFEFEFALGSGEDHDGGLHKRRVVRVVGRQRGHVLAHG